MIETVYSRGFQAVFRRIQPRFDWREPVRLEGEHAMRRLPHFLSAMGKRHVLLVTDNGIKEAGLLTEFEQACSENGLTVTVFAGVRSDPSTDEAEACAQVYRQSGADCITAVGGGSVIDCAKAAGAVTARPDKTLRKMKGILRVRHETPYTVCAPTTAGSGSEATLAAVITDRSEKEKMIINDFPLIPDAAVLDPLLTQSLPPALTAETGMDALTHAVEAYIGRSTTPKTRVWSEKAVSRIFSFLPRAYNDGDDLQARGAMLEAAHFAGLSFTRAYVGNVHAAAHALGAAYGFPHGRTNARILPYVLRMYGTRCTPALARLSQGAGLPFSTPEEWADTVDSMNKEMHIAPLKGIRTEDIPALARRARREANPLYPVPVVFNQRQMEELFYTIQKGESAL
ncbi:iron-containing alcohol dehydrogenase [Alkalicoccus urumqiensis]|uniref:Alcohol dehydrogenase n=1 Tax=Alkalicoccus urumqiensis TaxID=1548213 RepID=A0A2P6MJU0_ALKUR|nr:iron-containing alcohol dehydrogenase [Alkalicoccus urumqiensis]PRO66544.1 alcohol dehydrogenase [Alkalicoccus urumqiensis]